MGPFRSCTIAKSGSEFQRCCFQKYLDVRMVIVLTRKMLSFLIVLPEGADSLHKWLQNLQRDVAIEAFTDIHRQP